MGGALSFVGWTADIPRLTDWASNGISIQPNAAVAVTLAGLSLLCLQFGARRATAMLGFMVGFIGASALVQYVADVDFERLNTMLMFGREWGRVGVTSPGRMGPPGSTSWILLGTALVLASGQTSLRRLWALRLALLALAIAGLSLIGYSYGADRLFSLPLLTVIAFQTATFVAAVALGIIASVPERAPVSWFVDEGASGAIARRAIPLIVAIPFSLGLIRLWGQDAGLYDTRFGVAMLVLLLVILLLALLAWTLKTLTHHEAKLRQSQQQVHATLASIPDAYVTVDQDWRYRYVNASAAQHMGKAPADMIGRNVWDLFPESIGGTAFQALHRLAREGGLIEFEDHNPVIGRWFANRASRTSDGEIAVYFHDITARKAQESERVAELTAITRLQALSTRLVRSGDMESLLGEIVAAAAELTGTVKGNIQLHDPGSDSLRIVVHQGFGSAFIERFRQQRVPDGFDLAARERHRLVVPDLSADASRRGTPDLKILIEDGIAAFQSTPLISRGGQLLGMLSTYYTMPRHLSDAEVRHLDPLARMAADFIERAQAEEARVLADRRKDEFLAMLAHELRNPLAPLQNAIQLLRQSDGVSESVRSTTELLARQVNQLNHLVDDLVDVSRITRGRINLVRGVTDLNAAVRLATESVQPLIAEKGQLLETTLPDTAFVTGDLTRLAQVVTNLLRNANKFTPDGGHIRVIVETDGLVHVLRVRDDGIGIAPDHIPRVFDMFHQADTTLERSVSGLGIGLTLVRTLVTLHGGTVEASSEGANRGSEFVVRLPALQAVSTNSTEAQNGSGVASQSPRRILIVDDNEDGATSLASLLEIAGHSTEFVHDGQAAVVAAERFRPNVILLDIGLPKLNGIEVCRSIRQQPWGQVMTLVALTGWGSDADRKRSREAGFDHHVVKPIAYEELLRLVERGEVNELKSAKRKA